MFDEKISRIIVDDSGFLWIKTFEKEVFCIFYKELPRVLLNPNRIIIQKDTYNAGTSLEVNIYMYHFKDIVDFSTSTDFMLLPPDEESEVKPTTEPVAVSTTEPTVTPTEKPNTNSTATPTVKPNAELTTCILGNVTRDSSS